jgi:hypothetical protein
VKYFALFTVIKCPLSSESTLQNESLFHILVIYRDSSRGTEENHEKPVAEELKDKFRKGNITDWSQNCIICVATCWVLYTETQVPKILIHMERYTKWLSSSSRIVCSKGDLVISVRSLLPPEERRRTYRDVRHDETLHREDEVRFCSLYLAHGHTKQRGTDEKESVKYTLHHRRAQAASSPF